MALTRTQITIGNAEDVQDYIYLLANDDVPFVSMCQGLDSNSSAITAMAVKTEWLHDILLAPKAHTTGEEDAAPTALSDQPTRADNQCQIFSDAYSGTTRTNVIKTYGRSSETQRNLQKRGREQWRDLEYACIGADLQSKQVGNGAGTPDRMACAQVQVAAGNRDQNGGTPRAFTEDMVLRGSQIVAREGGRPNAIFVTDLHAEIVAGWAHAQPSNGGDAGSRIRDFTTGKEIVNVVDYYTGPHGRMAVVKDWIMAHTTASATTVTAMVVDTNYWGIATLERQQTGPISSDSLRHENYEVYMDKTLCCLNPLASYSLEDLSPAGT